MCACVYMCAGVCVRICRRVRGGVCAGVCVAAYVQACAWRRVCRRVHASRHQHVETATLASEAEGACSRAAAHGSGALSSCLLVLPNNMQCKW